MVEDLFVPVTPEGWVIYPSMSSEYNKGTCSGQCSLPIGKQEDCVDEPQCCEPIYGDISFDVGIIILQKYRLQAQLLLLPNICIDNLFSCQIMQQLHMFCSWKRMTLFCQTSFFLWLPAAAVCHVPPCHPSHLLAL